MDKVPHFWGFFSVHVWSISLEMGFYSKSIAAIITTANIDLIAWNSKFWLLPKILKMQNGIIF